MQVQRVENTLQISGELNVLQLTGDMLDHFFSAFDQNVTTIDFDGITSSDSSGILLILHALRQHKVTLKNLPKSIQLLIDLYGLNSFVEVL